MGDTYEECLLLVTGETVSLNTFDKIFRSGYGPQWSDRPVPIPPIIHSMRCFQFRRLFSAAALMPRGACGAKSTGNPAMTCWICRSDGRLGEDNTAFLCRSRCRRTFPGCVP